MFIFIGSNGLMKCYIQLILIALLILTLSSCRSSSSMSRIEKLSSMRSAYSVESLDLIITPISLPPIVACSDSSSQCKPFVPGSFRVKGVRAIHSADNVLFVDSSNQQKEKGHEAPPVANSASRLIENILYVITFLIFIFILRFVFRIVASRRSDAS